MITVLTMEQAGLVSGGIEANQVSEENPNQPGQTIGGPVGIAGSFSPFDAPQPALPPLPGCPGL
jgi:hypothetical protein